MAPRRRSDSDAAVHLLVQLLRRATPTQLLILGLIVLAVLLVVVIYQWISIPTVTRGPEVPNLPAGEGWYELHFTSPEIPTNKAHYQGGLDEHLVKLIQRATRTLDMAVYDFDLVNVAEAMAAARGRGVQVRMVTDSDTLHNVKNDQVQAAFARLREAGIPIVEDKRNAIMHDKFTVVDGEWLETGSWNYTTGDTYRLNNNMIIIHSPELAANYTAEFEKMFVRRQFGPSKERGAPHPVVVVDGARIHNLFAPQDHVAEAIIGEILKAQHSIRFLAFSFTHGGIGQAMIARARAGVQVNGVFETTGSNTPYSQLKPMKEAGLDVWKDGNPYPMHHKVIIIDDQTVIFGSFNFSESADRSNDENVLIVTDPGLAGAFKAEFDRVMAVARNPPGKP